MIIHPKDRQVPLAPEHILKIKTREELRKWYEENAASEKEVYVHCIRREHESIMSYLDVVEEALCFGWIDSTTKKILFFDTTINYERFKAF